MVDEKYENNNNPNYWKILTDTEYIDRGDSNHYSEAFWGRYGEIYVIYLFDKTSDLGFLLDKVDIFVA